MAVTVKEVTDNTGITTRRELRDNTYLDINSAKRTFHVNGLGEQASFVAYMAAAGQVAGIPPLDDVLAGLNRNGRPLRSKYYTVTTLDPINCRIEIQYDDDVATEFSVPSLLPEEDWSFSSRMTTRETFVDVNQNPIYVNYDQQGKDGQSLGIVKDVRRSASVRQQYPIIEARLNLIKPVSELARYFRLRGRINSDTFFDEEPGMWLCSGIEAMPILYEVRPPFGKRPLWYRIVVTCVLAGPPEIVTVTLGGNLKKKGHDQLAYYIDNTTKDVVRATQAVNTIVNGPDSPGAPEVVVPVYLSTSFADIR